MLEPDLLTQRVLMWRWRGSSRSPTRWAEYLPVQPILVACVAELDDQEFAAAAPVERQKCESRLYGARIGQRPRQCTCVLVLFADEHRVTQSIEGLGRADRPKPVHAPFVQDAEQLEPAEHTTRVVQCPHAGSRGERAADCARRRTSSGAQLVDAGEDRARQRNRARLKQRIVFRRHDHVMQRRASAFQICAYAVGAVPIDEEMNHARRSPPRASTLSRFPSASPSACPSQS